MGKIEEFLTSIDPLVLAAFSTVDESYYLRPDIRYNVIQDTIDVYFSPFGGGKGSIFLCSEIDKSYTLYFSLYPSNSYKFIKNIEVLQKKNSRIIFSGSNVFNYLNLGNTYGNSPNCSLADLHNLCFKIKANIPIIHEAFSDKNIEKTYAALSSMEGNNEEEINRRLKTLFPE